MRHQVRLLTGQMILIQTVELVYINFLNNQSAATSLDTNWSLQKLQKHDFFAVARLFENDFTLI